jgi:hypothetical protein
LGPFTRTDSGSIATVTPAGTGMGCLPILDIRSLTRPARGPRRRRPRARVVAGHHAVEVETIDVPMPPSTLGMCFAST